MRACVAPVCDLKTEVEVILPIMEKLKPCCGNVNEVTFKNIRKMPGSKIVQVKGLMPQKDGWHKPKDTHRQSRCGSMV